MVIISLDNVILLIRIKNLKHSHKAQTKSASARTIQLEHQKLLKCLYSLLGEWEQQKLFDNVNDKNSNAFVCAQLLL